MKLKLTLESGTKLEYDYTIRYGAYEKHAIKIFQSGTNKVLFDNDWYPHIEKVEDRIAQSTIHPWRLSKRMEGFMKENPDKTHFIYIRSDMLFLSENDSNKLISGIKRLQIAEARETKCMKFVEERQREEEEKRKEEAEAKAKAEKRKEILSKVTDVHEVEKTIYDEGGKTEIYYYTITCKDGEILKFTHRNIFDFGTVINPCYIIDPNDPSRKGGFILNENGITVWMNFDEKRGDHYVMRPLTQNELDAVSVICELSKFHCIRMTQQERYAR